MVVAGTVIATIARGVASTAVERQKVRERKDRAIQKE